MYLLAWKEQNMTQTDIIEQPLRIDSHSELDWHETAQVVVVGLGCAGASAALEASEQGADVLLIDRFEGGGATAYSGGIYYAGDTRHQREAGYQDSAENMYNYLIHEVGDAVRPETVRKFCEDSATNLEWLEKHGVRFEGSVFTGKTTYPPEDKYLYFSGNEKISQFAKFAEPAPRGHRTYGKGWTGHAFFAGLKGSIERSNIRCMTHARAMRLIVDKEERVIGVEVLEIPEGKRTAHQDLYKEVDPMKPFSFKRAEKTIEDCERLEQIGGRRCIRAVKGVVLATGGYALNLDMLKENLPKYAESAEYLMRLGSLSCNGSGIQLGQSVGAALGKMDRLFAGRVITPPFELLNGIIVNQEGRRFINEDAYNATLGEAIADQADSKAWLILDNKKFWAAFRSLFPMGDGNFKTFKLPILLNILFGGTKRAGTLTDLATKCSIDPGGLENEVSQYNGVAASGQPDIHNKLNDHFKEIRGKSYYAINVSMKSRFAFVMFFTLGGIKVDEVTGMATRQDGTQINGLYAAGRAAVGLCGNSYACSGISLADGVFSGRRAGRSCAQAPALANEQNDVVIELKSSPAG